MGPARRAPVLLGGYLAVQAEDVASGVAVHFRHGELHQVAVKRCVSVPQYAGVHVDAVLPVAGGCQDAALVIINLRSPAAAPIGSGDVGGYFLVGVVGICGRAVPQHKVGRRGVGRRPLHRVALSGSFNQRAASRSWGPWTVHLYLPVFGQIGSDRSPSLTLTSATPPM